MPFERCVHGSIQRTQGEGIQADQVRRQLFQPGANAFGVGWQIKRAQRTNLPEAHLAGVGFDLDDRAVEHLDRLAPGPFVAAFMQGQIDLIGADACDFHVERFVPNTEGFGWREF